SQFGEDHVHSLLHLLHGTAMDDGSMQDRIEGSRLFLLAPPALHEQVRSELRELLGAVGRPIELEVAVYAAEGTPPATVLAPGEAAAALTGRTPLCRSSATVRSNKRLPFDQLRWSRYVHSIGIEVAQKSSVPVPQGNAFAEGLAAVVEVHSLANSE